VGRTGKPGKKEIDMTIAVTGATGQFGRIVIEELKKKGADVIALARSPEKAADLGVEVRAGDYEKPRDWAAALKGVETLLLVSGSEIGKRAAQHRTVIEAAKAAGVKRIVYTSLLNADTSTIGLAPEHIETEALIRASGIPFTILRNGWYFENHSGSIAASVQHGAFIGSAGEGRFSSASRRDFAEAAVAAVLSDAHSGQTIELAGDEGFTLRELAAEISRQSGKTVPYVDMPEGDYAAALTQAGLPAPMAGAYASFDTAAAGGALHSDSRELSGLIGRPTTTLQQAVEAALS
jgi:NAD(P)H dehydrogenase (quinone)